MGTDLVISPFAEIISRYPHEQPLPFLANVPAGSHLALFWESADAARLVEFWYLLHGLVRGEHCIYTTHEDPNQIRDQMVRRGLDVDYYERRKGNLHIIEIEDPINDPAGLTNGVGEVVKKIFANTEPPYRIVSRWIRNFNSEDGKTANIEVESTCHKGYLGQLPNDNPYSMFKHFEGSMICHYPVDKLNLNTHSEWIRNHLSTHHAAIYVPDSHNAKLIRLY